MKILSTVSGTLLTACFLLRASAAPYLGSAYEPFDYLTAVDAAKPATDADLNANNRGPGWNATGDPAQANTTAWGGAAAPFLVASSNVVAGSLTHLVMPVANRLQISPTTASGNAGRLFGQPVDAGTFYLSFTLQRLTDSIRTINLALFAGTVERFGFGQYATATVGATSNGNLAGVFLNSNPTNLLVGTGGAAAIPMGTGVTHLIIIRIDFNVSGVNDRVRVYVDPGSLADEAVLTPYLDNSAFDMTTLTALRPFCGGSTTTPVALAAASAAFDEIRLGSTFASVTSALVPDLSITGDASLATVSWPASFSWCLLQQSTFLDAMPWTTSTGIEDNGIQKSLSVPSPAGRLFFRLARP